MTIRRWFAMFLVLSALVPGFAACDRKGPAERTGEKIDRAADKAGDKIEDATDRNR